MSFLRPKVPAQPATPTPVQSPTDTLNSLARVRRLSGGRNSFAPPISSAGSARLATVTGVQA